MLESQTSSRCYRCGYTSSGQFVGDICPGCDLTFWKCGKCGFTFTSTRLPRACPVCGEKCNFRNVTCYVPECGGPGHIDFRIY